jgi:hypothetical protein
LVDPLNKDERNGSVETVGCRILAQVNQNGNPGKTGDFMQRSLFVATLLAGTLYAQALVQIQIRDEIA